MSSSKPQAISGLSPGIENTVRIEYPSVASTGLGRALGRLYNSIPLKIGGIKLSYLLFTLPTAVFGLIMYVWLKTLGQRFILTNKSVQVWTAISGRLLSEVALSEAAEVVVHQEPGQAFYKAADIYLLAADGSSLMRLGGVVRAEVFRQTIIEARDAELQVAASLAIIQARQTV